jgi:uncharacterized protein YcbK (DUF882 family)
MERNTLFSELAQIAYPSAHSGNGVLYEATSADAVRFPSGETLLVVDLKSGRGEEHWDVTGSGHPLLDTSGANQQKMLSRNFSVREFARNGQSVARIDPRLVATLQQIRDAIGKPLNITSGYRSYLYNKRLYGKRNQEPTKSKHIAGSAVDFNVAGMNGLELAKKVVDILGKAAYGIGLGKHFIHLDVLRNKFETWPYSDIDKGWTTELSRYYRNAAGPAARPHVPVREPSKDDGVGLIGNITNLGSAVIALIQDGITDPNAITNFVFQIRHPELKGRKLAASDPQSLKNEWLQLREKMVLPLLQKIKTAGNGTVASVPTAPVLPPAAGSSTLQTGKLIVDTKVPALSKSFPSYTFTQEDALWLGRFVIGEAGGKNTPDNHAVIWAMFNRFGVFRHRVASWTSFSVFIRKYSTTLQPLLNSLGAAKRVYRNHKENPQKYPIVQGTEYYKNSTLLKVQYKKHIDLQLLPWNKMPAEVQQLVSHILSGRIPNPGIGMASEFASTMVYYKDTYGHPPATDAAWISFTNEFARKKEWTWIGLKPTLNQKKNAFFIDNRLKDVPAGAVKIIP